MMPTIMKSSLLLILATISATSAFVAPHSATNLRHITPTFITSSSDVASSINSNTQLYSHKLVLVRHGESTWNDLNIFTGWADASLNEKGLAEAAEGGKLLKEGGFTFDVAYTSVLKRAIKTLWIILEELDLMYIPIVSLLFECIMLSNDMLHKKTSSCSEMKLDAKLRLQSLQLFFSYNVIWIYVDYILCTHTTLFLFLLVT